MKIEDVRIGQEVYWVAEDDFKVKSFIVKGIRQGYKENTWDICSKLDYSTAEYLDSEKCYCSFPEAMLVLDVYCTNRINQLNSQKESIDEKIKQIQMIKYEILERCR